MTDLPVLLYAAYNGHQPASVARLYDTDATHEEIAQGRIVQGPERIADGLRRFFIWFPDAHWTPRSQITDPDGKIAITYLLTATLQAPMGPIPARGQRLSLRGTHVLHLNGSAISRSEDYWDAATFQRQLNTINKGETV